MSLEQFSKTSYDLGTKEWMYINAQQVTSKLPIVASSYFSEYSSNGGSQVCQHGNSRIIFSSVADSTFQSVGITFTPVTLEINVTVSGYYQVNIGTTLTVLPQSQPITGNALIYIEQNGAVFSPRSIANPSITGDLSWALTSSGIVYIPALPNQFVLMNIQNNFAVNGIDIDVTAVSPYFSITALDLVSPPPVLSARKLISINSKEFTKEFAKEFAKTNLTENKKELILLDSFSDEQKRIHENEFKTEHTNSEWIQNNLFSQIQNDDENIQPILRLTSTFEKLNKLKKIQEFIEIDSKEHVNTFKIESLPTTNSKNKLVSNIDALKGLFKPSSKISKEPTNIMSIELKEPVNHGLRKVSKSSDFERLKRIHEMKSKFKKTS
jgi:hypothetical protein